MNEAALLAARKDKDAVEMEDSKRPSTASWRGWRRKSLLSDKEKEIVAYHESGHAVAASLPSADPVHRISIVPRGIAALGYTLQLPTEDRYLMTRSSCLTNSSSSLAAGWRKNSSSMRFPPAPIRLGFVDGHRRRMVLE